MNSLLTIWCSLALMLIEPVESGNMTFVSNTTTTVIQQHSNSTYGIEDEGMNKKERNDGIKKMW